MNLLRFSVLVSLVYVISLQLQIHKLTNQNKSNQNYDEMYKLMYLSNLVQNNHTDIIEELLRDRYLIQRDMQSISMLSVANTLKINQYIYEETGQFTWLGELLDE